MSAPWQPPEDFDDDEDNQLDDIQYQNQKDATLFMIDVSKSMLNPDEEDPTSNPVRTALECAYKVLLQRIISNPKDVIGIVLHGTEQTKVNEGQTYSNIYVLLDLDVPDAQGIKGLKTILEDENAFNELCTPSERPVSITNVLFCANQIFTSKAPNFNSKRLFLITDNEDPHASNPQARKSAFTRARDLNDLGIRIEPFFIRSGEGKFDVSKFWEQVVLPADVEETEEDEPELVMDAKTRYKHLLSAITAKSVPKRAIFSVPFELGPGFQIGVKGYILFKRQEATKSNYVWTRGSIAKLVETKSEMVCQDTTRTLQTTDVKKAFKFGGEPIVFNKDELTSLRVIEDPILRLLGFKPLDYLKFEWNTRPSYFIYPTDADITGSIRTFSALHKQMLSSSRMGLAWLVARRNASPVFVAMVASQEVTDPETKVQKQPAGIHLIPLPYADDIRSFPDNTTTRAPDSLIDKMHDIVASLSIGGYQPEKYRNPALQWHYRILQAVALDEDLPTQGEDDTIPKYRGIDRRAGDHIAKWAKELEKVSFATTSVPVKPPSARKRGGEDGGERSVPKKRVKEELTWEYAAMLYEKDALSKLTVAQMKSLLAEKGVKAPTKKDDCIQAMETVLDN
ncbi:ATP-dependent DNA helicase II subunit 1 [Saitoella coloradoensis]